MGVQGIGRGLPKLAIVVSMLALTAPAGAVAADWSQVTPPDMSRLFSDPAYIASATAARTAQDAAADQRGTAAQRSARVRSRTQFADLSSVASRQLAQQRFPQLMLDDLDALGLPRGVTVQRYLAANVAAVANADGKRSLVVGTDPLAVRTDSGSLAGVDLSLRAAATGFTAQRPVAPVLIPRRADRYLTFDRSGLGVRPGGAAAAAGAAQEDRVFYADVETDTDYAAMPTRAGAEVLWQLRSRTAAEALPLQLDLPAGATLRLASAVTGPVGSVPAPGAAGAEVVRDGTVLATVTPPKAFDADGAAVPASYRVDGDRLVVDVPHRAGGYKYPIVVDPEVREIWGGGDFAAGCNTAGARNWHTQAWGTQMAAWCNDSRYGGGGLYVGSFAGWVYQSDSRTQWYWGTPPYVHIISAWLDGTWARTVGSHMYDGIAGPYGWESIHNDYGDAMNGNVSHVANPGNDTNAVVFGLYMDCCWNNDPRPYEGLAAIRGANVRIGDYYAPYDVRLTNIVPKLTENWAGVGATPWIDGNTTVTASAQASDAGLGLNHVGILPTSHDWFTGHNLIACNGYISSPCPNSASFSGALDLQQRKGLVALQTFASDITDNFGYGPQFIVKMDRDNPSIQMTGDLVTHATDGQLNATPTVHVAITDGSNASAETFQSGVKRVLVTLDGNVLHDWNNPNGDGTNNDFGWDYTVNAGAPGQHTLLVRAWDYLGHMGSWNQPFTTPGAPAAAFPEQPGRNDGLAGSDVGTGAYGDVGTPDACVDGACDSTPVASEASSPQFVWGIHDMALAGLGGYVNDTACTTGLGADPPFASLLKTSQHPGVRAIRLVIPYNLAVQPVPAGAACGMTAQQRGFVGWLSRVQALGLEPLISFEHRSSDYTSLPTDDEYRDAVHAFITRWGTPAGITHYTAWNEPNHTKQPTRLNSTRPAVWHSSVPAPAANAHFGAAMAGRYWRILRSECSGCVVGAGDFLDRGDFNFTGNWTSSYVRYLYQTPTVWAFHPYSGMKNGTTGSLKDFVRGTHTGNVWITEVGPLWQSSPTDKPQDATTYSAATVKANYQAWMAQLGGVSNRVTRLYMYQYKGDFQWDTGLADHPYNVVGQLRADVYCEYKMTVGAGSC